MTNNQSLRLGFIAGLPEGAPVPAEFQVFPEGLVQIEGAEPFVVDGAAMSAVVERFGARGIDMVVDYEHETESGGVAPAAGWIKRLENRGKDGLWAVVDWTERAREYLAKKEYRYFSPVFLVSSDGRKLAELLRVALTNAPRLNGIMPITTKSTIRNNCTNSTGRKGMEFLEIIAKEVGLPETASVEEVSGAIGKLKATADAIACKEVLDALGVDQTTGKSEVVATIHALRQKTDLTLEVAALKSKLIERERDDIVSAALREGKITPAQREWAEKYALGDAEGFRLFVAKAPQVVPVEQLGARSVERSGVTMDEKQLHINKLLGISEETWKKHNG